MRSTGRGAEFIAIIASMSIPGKLHRRPFLAPVGLAALTAFLGALILIAAAWVLVRGGSTTIIVVREVEKVGDGGALVRMFGDSHLEGSVDAIYVSPDQRSTAAPLAARLALTPEIFEADDAHALVRRMLREHRGGRILLIGPANAVPAIIMALSGADSSRLSTGDAQNGRLYIVAVPRIGRANIISLSY